MPTKKNSEKPGASPDLDKLKQDVEKGADYLKDKASETWESMPEEHRVSLRQVGVYAVWGLAALGGHVLLSPILGFISWIAFLGIEIYLGHKIFRLYFPKKEAIKS